MRLALVLAVAMAFSSCGPDEGPLGIHEGDRITRSKNTKGEWIESGSVSAVGNGWVEIRGKRYTAEDLAGVRITCFHD